MIRLFGKRIFVLGLMLLSSSAYAAVSVESITNVWPVMVRMPENTVMKLKFTVKDEKKPVALGLIKLDLTGTSRIQDVDSVELFLEETSKDDKGKTKVSRKKVASGKVTSKKVNLRCNESLDNGVQTFILSVAMKDKADLDGKVTLRVSSVTLANKDVEQNDLTVTQRIGYAIAKRGDLKSKNFRIPGIATSKKTGTMVSVYDIRYNHPGDLPARIDVGVARSTNGGKTWTKTKVVMTTEGLDGGFGIGDPAILCDDKTGMFWIAALWSPKSGHPIWKSAKGSVAKQNCGQYVLISSNNDGKSWSKLMNITADVKRLSDADTKDWGVVFQGPGNGLCMQDGTLVFPSQIWGHNGGAPHHGVLVYSKDNGKTWTSSAQMPFGGSESTAVETTPGTLLLNTREGNGWKRMVGETKDLGKTWTKHASLTTPNGTLRQPGGCQAALLKVESDGKSTYYFTNPDGGSRKDMTVKFSDDECVTWSKGLLYDERNCAGYSSIAPADKNHIGVLYEGTGSSEAIYFLRIPYDEILQSK